MMQPPSGLSPRLTPRLSYLLFRLALVLLCAAAFLALTLPILAANPGDLDPGFGNNGVVAPSLFGGNFLSNAIAIQPDGKIVTAGYDPNPDGLFVVLRHNPDGSFDSNFGNGGVVTSSFSSVNNGPGPVGLALQPDGKLVVVSTKNISYFLKVLVVTRYTITGSLDSSFGQGGVVTTTVDKTTGFFIGVAIQDDGRIIAAGSSANNADQENFSLVRFTAAGSLDNTFGSGGVVTTSIPGRRTRGYGVVIQSSGKIVIAGSSGVNNVPNTGTFVLARYTTNGILDSTFGNSGIVTTSIDSSASGDAVAIQPDDKIIIIGSSGGLTPTSTAFALARYNSNGSLDNDFGSGGVVTATINGYGDGNGIALQPDGKIVAVGTGKTVSNTNTFALARYNSDGSLDNSFGTNGIITPLIGDGGNAWNVAIQPADHKIVVVGNSSLGSEYRYTLVRYFGDASGSTHQVYLPVVLKQ